MQYVYHSFLVKLYFLLLLCPLTGCHFDAKETAAVYEKYKFDQEVIERLPVYDSLATAVLERFSFFQQNMHKNESYHAFRYMPFSTRDDVFNKLPPSIAPGIDRYFGILGKDFVYGFDVFKDSTIKIYIRSIPAANSELDIEENLSYYPDGKNIQRREFPHRDTILNKHWQYWARFKNPVLF